MSSSSTHRQSADDSQRVWDLLCRQTDALVEAWNSGSEPALEQFLPDAAPTLRRMVLNELVKVDLEQRWQPGRTPWRLEEYLAALPELGGRDRLPCDLIYEEFHIRKQSGIEVDPQEYFARFPAQAPELIRLLGLEAPYLTTSCTGRQSLQDLEPGQKIDDFELLVRLGRGAFATVYLARQVSMQRLVALKVSTSRSNEPQTLAQLDHPHIVRVFDQRVLPDQKLRLLYMQYVAGGTLASVVDAVRQTPIQQRRGQILLETIDRELLNRGETPPSDSRNRHFLARASWPEAVCWLGARLAAALDYAHGRGVLHRDIKPANVLLAADAGPKLVDFNISFSSKLEGVSPAAYFGGSLAYMSPEQLEACNPQHDRDPGELDGRSDVYSLGIVLWELLAGARPFEDKLIEGDRPGTLSRMCERRQAGIAPQAWAQLPTDRPQGLDAILSRCLAPAALNRFASAGSLARQLELCLRPEAQRLMAPPKHRLRRFLRTWPGALATLIVAGVLPNVLLSVLNIYSNSQLIVRWLNAEAQHAFWNQLVTVNSVFYSISITLGIFLHYRVLSGLSAARAGTLRFARGRKPTQAGSVANGADSSAAFAATVDPTWLRRRTLDMGLFVALIIEAAWTMSGIAFPAILDRYVTPPGSLEPWAWGVFMISQVLCGLLSGTLGFFLITFVCVRFIYPVFLEPDSTSEADLAPLARTRTRVWWQTGLACLLPLAGLTLVVLSGSDLAQARPFFAALGGLGIAATAVALTLLGVILRDLLALAQVVGPAGDEFGSGSELSESYWTGSNR